MLMNMTDLLKVANEHNFAVPAFNIGTGMILNAVIERCEALQAPVILAIHPSELKFQGDNFIESVKAIANSTKIPCVIHLDHAEEKDIYRAVRDGFTSVMIDASSLPFEENVAVTKKIVDFCRPLNVSVEGELGTIGTTGQSFEGGVSSTEIRYTQPEEARKFIDLTGVDTLAIAIGTCHGIYPKGFQPNLQQDLLSKIKQVVPETPLVLHGGSSNKDSEIAEACKRGINKINISSDIKDAFYQELRNTLKDPYIREPFELYLPAIKAMNEVIDHKIKLFNDDDKVKYYKLG